MSSVFASDKKRMLRCVGSLSNEMKWGVHYGKVVRAKHSGFHQLKAYLIIDKMCSAYVGSDALHKDRTAKTAAGRSTIHSFRSIKRANSSEKIKIQPNLDANKFRR